jgi:choline dehydrogenase-like flavoprotein
MALTPARRTTLDALARIIVPQAYSSAAAGRTDLTPALEERILRVPAAIAADIELVLDLFGGRIASLAVLGRLRPISALAPDDAARAFAAWGQSRLAIARTAYQAIRGFVLSTYYATPTGLADLPVLPPLHTRVAVLPWEGPVPGARTLDSEPVARAPRGTRVVPGADPTDRGIPSAVTLGSALVGAARLRTDVVVVGSGAGGAVAATRLAEAGHEVVILESGEYLHAPDFSEVEAELMPRLFAEQGMRATTDASISLLQGAAAGGGTTVNWMLMLRTPDYVLEEWEREHGVTGLSWAELNPEFDRIEREVHARVVPDDAHSPSNRLILDGARALGWRASAMAINAAGCVRAGTCSLGCRYDAKQSALLTFLPRAFVAGARLYANTRVERVEIVERSTGHGTGTPPLKRVHAVVKVPGTDSAPAAVIIEAPIVILAAGAIETPVILQRSGLGGGGVGRFLRLHPTTVVLGRYAQELYTLAGVPQSTMCDEFIRRDANGYGFWIECPALQPALASVAVSGFGDSHRRDMQQLHHVAPFIVLVRDGSGTDRSNGTVSLDRRGRTRIRYRVGPTDRMNLVAGIEAAARLHFAADALEAITLHTPPIRLSNAEDGARIRRAPIGANQITLFSAHVNGTCRIGVDPARSGATPEGERHGVRGLYILDGSLLPTSLGVNPQETIMAVASVLSDRLARR